MSAQAFEITLARLYTDAVFRAQFLDNAEQALKELDLTEAERNHLREIDRTGLVLAANSFMHKRKRKPKGGFLYSLMHIFGIRTLINKMSSLL